MLKDEHMKVYGQNELIKFTIKHADSGKAMLAWLDAAERSIWQTPQDIKHRYPSADFLSDNRVIFNIKGNHYRMLVKMNYRTRAVLVEWIGTHAEYDKLKFQ